MVRALRVSDVMTRSLVKADPSTNILDCAELMIKKRVGSVLIIDKKRLHGVLGERDIVWAITKKDKKDLKNVLAKDIVNKKFMTIKPHLELDKAISKMRKSGFKRLPVVYKGNVVGILTMKDILRVDPSLYNSISDFLQIKEEDEKIRRREKLFNEPHQKSLTEGLCEECSNYDLLFSVDGRMICEECIEEM